MVFWWCFDSLVPANPKKDHKTFCYEWITQPLDITAEISALRRPPRHSFTDKHSSPVLQLLYGSKHCFLTAICISLPNVNFEFRNRLNSAWLLMVFSRAAVWEALQKKTKTALGWIAFSVLISLKDGVGHLALGALLVSLDLVFAERDGFLDFGLLLLQPRSRSFISCVTWRTPFNCIHHVCTRFLKYRRRWQEQVLVGKLMTRSTDSALSSLIEKLTSMIRPRVTKTRFRLIRHFLGDEFFFANISGCNFAAAAVFCFSNSSVSAWTSIFTSPIPLCSFMFIF